MFVLRFVTFVLLQRLEKRIISCYKRGLSLNKDIVIALIAVGLKKRLYSCDFAECIFYYFPIGNLRQHLLRKQYQALPKSHSAIERRISWQTC